MSRLQTEAGILGVDGKQRCWACDGSRFGPLFKAREMMLGLREEFDYGECLDCGSLQIASVPSDLGRYYPSSYCSFSSSLPPSSPLGTALKPFRTAIYSGRLFSEPLDKIATALRPNPIRSAIESLLPNLPVVHHMNVLAASTDAKVLDVGSGAGHFLRTLRALGFESLTGADPFIEKETRANGITLLKKDLFGVEGTFDIIVFNHSLEHIQGPVDVLRRAREMLSSDGKCMVRTPVAGSHAWSVYRENWVQLDPPRHLLVPSVSGFVKLAERSGLFIYRKEFDSTWLQFYGSEQYRRDVPFLSPRSHAVDPSKGMFSKMEMRRFAAMATRLNNEGRGDQAAFYLRKS